MSVHVSTHSLPSQLLLSNHHDYIHRATLVYGLHKGWCPRAAYASNTVQMLVTVLQSLAHRSLLLPCLRDCCKLVSRELITLCGGVSGCGKSTQVPQYILEEAIAAGEGAACNIICTQPRRISAVGVSTRVAQVLFVLRHSIVVQMSVLHAHMVAGMLAVHLSKLQQLCTWYSSITCVTTSRKTR